MILTHGANSLKTGGLPEGVVLYNSIKNSGNINDGDSQSFILPFNRSTNNVSFIVDYQIVKSVNNNSMFLLGYTSSSQCPAIQLKEFMSQTVTYLYNSTSANTGVVESISLARKCRCLKNNVYKEYPSGPVIASNVPFENITPSNIYIGYYSGGAYTCKIYNVKILDSNDNPIYDLVPATYNGTPCLYDQVSRTVIMNTNSGTKWVVAND